MHPYQGNRTKQTWFYATQEDTKEGQRTSISIDTFYPDVMSTKKTVYSSKQVIHQLQMPTSSPGGALRGMLLNPITISDQT